MTFRLRMLVADPKRIIVTTIVGCRDADHAKAKARELYHVVTFKSVELAK